MNSPNKTDQRKKREHNLPKSEFNKGIITTDPHGLMGPKSAVLIGQNGDTLIGQWRCRWDGWAGNIAAQLRLDGAHLHAIG